MFGGFDLRCLDPDEDKCKSTFFVTCRTCDEDLCNIRENINKSESFLISFLVFILILVCFLF